MELASGKADADVLGNRRWQSLRPHRFGCLRQPSRAEPVAMDALKPENGPRWQFTMLSGHFEPGREMGQFGRLVLCFANGFGIVFALLVGTAGIGHGQKPTELPGGTVAPRSRLPRSGVGYDTAEWWHHVSQGAVFMPYQWFIALEQASGDELFAATDHLERLGLSH